MKKLFLTAMILVLMIGISSAATLHFDPAENADGYKAYYTDGTEQFSNDLGARTSVDLAEFNLTPGTWTFYVTAYNTVGESGASNTAEWSMAEYSVSDNPKPITIVIPGPVTISINNQAIENGRPSAAGTDTGP